MVELKKPSTDVLIKLIITLIVIGVIALIVIGVIRSLIPG